MRRLGTEPAETLDYPDQLRGQLKLFGNRKRDADLELGDVEHDAGHVDGIAEELGLT